MHRSRSSLLALIILIAGHPCVHAADKESAEKDPRAPYTAFNTLIGSWRGTGEPEGSRAEKQQGFWIETISWEWQFKDQKVWLKVAFEKGKYFQSGELRYLADKHLYQLTALTPTREKVVFEGKLEEKRLTLDRIEPKTKEAQRIVITFLHSNRFLYRYEVKKPERTSFTRVYQVGATKEGVPFAGPGDTDPECIVSGGKGTMAVSYKGKTYYVCCSGCRDEFKANPEKYIKEYEAKRKK